MATEIHQFFEHYRDAFNELDGDAVASLYDVPSGMLTDRGYLHWASYEPIRDNMVQLCRRYRDSGYVSASFEPTTFITQGSRFAVADLGWRIERTCGLEPRCFRVTYNLRRTPDGWRVVLAIAGKAAQCLMTRRRAERPPHIRLVQ